MATTNPTQRCPYCIAGYVVATDYQTGRYFNRPCLICNNQNQTNQKEQR